MTTDKAEKVRRATFKRPELVELDRTIVANGVNTAGIFTYKDGWSDAKVAETLAARWKRPLSADDVKRYRLSIKMKLGDEGRTKSETIEILLRSNSELVRKVDELARRVVAIETELQINELPTRQEVSRSPHPPPRHDPQPQVSIRNGGTMKYAANGGR